MMLVLKDQPASSFSPHGTKILLSFSHFGWYPRTPTRMVLAVDAQIDILNLVFFARPSTSSIFQTVSPTISRQVG